MASILSIPKDNGTKSIPQITSMSSTDHTPIMTAQNEDIQ